MPSLRHLSLDLVAETKGDIPNHEQHKQYLAQMYKKKLRSCGYCGHFSPTLRALELDHLDGNHGNFSEDNLELACHWCHAARHLEFALRAGACLVLWDFPQAAISRLTLQSLQTSYLGGIYERLVIEGRYALEHKFPDGKVNNIDLQLRARLQRGDQAGAQRILTTLQEQGVRLAFPEAYLSRDTAAPGKFSKTDWNTICAYYKRLKTNVLVDNERRVDVSNHLRDIVFGATAQKKAEATKKQETT